MIDKIKSCIGENVLVDPEPVIQKRGALFIPEKHAKQQYARTGRVLLVSPDIKGCEVAVGDRILFGQFAGDKVEQLKNSVDDHYLFIRHCDIIAVVGENDKF